MKELFNKYGLEITEKQLYQFKKYYELLVEYNQKFNITAITEKEQVYIKHFIDCLLGIDFIESGSVKLIDVGSGGGFPAIPIKIMREDIELTMLEATGKKCEFLRVVCEELKLNNVTVVNDRAEIKAKDENFREKFDYCTARAVARLNTLCEYCTPFIKKGGKFLAFKGDVNEELEESKNAFSVLNLKLEDKKEFLLEDAKRCVLKILKTDFTNKKYPRGNGKERKNPL